VSQAQPVEQAACGGDGAPVPLLMHQQPILYPSRPMSPVKCIKLSEGIICADQQFWLYGEGVFG
jgi:hypothetical protein